MIGKSAFCGAKPMQINTEAFSALNFAIFEKLNPEPWRGKSPIKWCEDVTRAPCDRVTLLGAGPEPMDRGRLFKFCARSDVEAEDIFFAVCAWGGMRVNNGRRAWPCAHKWGPAINGLRTDCPNRRAAYRLFSCLRAENNLPGVGPAYFTKLIFFVRPSLRGYIMDQWTARSINLLYGSTIRLTQGHSVAENAPEIYEDFCDKIEDVGERLRLSPDEAERVLFCSGGIRPGHWRSYVKRHG
jgi:hypothetical protein